MKRINLYTTVTTTVCLLASLTLSGCGVSKEISTEQRKHIDFGLVITTEQDRDSRILWFDKDLNLQQEQGYTYAGLGSHFTSPPEMDNGLFLPLKELVVRSDTRKVIRFDKDSLGVKEYPTEKGGVDDIAVMNNRIYTISGYGYLESTDISTNEHIVLEQHSKIPSSIIATDNKVYVFSSGLTSSDNVISKETFWVDIYTPDLKLLETRDMTSYGAVTNKHCEDAEYLYLTGSFDSDSNRTSKIIRLNKTTYEMTEWQIPGSEPLSDIYHYKDGFLVTRYTPVTDTGNQVLLIDSEGKVVHSALIEGPATTTAMVDNMLIVANDECVSSYSLPDLQLIKKQSISIEGKRWILSGGSPKYYLSALLMVGKPKS